MVLDVLRRLPDDCSLSEVIHHLKVVRAIETGLLASNASGMMASAQIDEELRRIWGKAPRI